MMGNPEGWVGKVIVAVKNLEVFTKPQESHSPEVPASLWQERIDMRCIDGEDPATRGVLQQQLGGKLL